MRSSACKNVLETVSKFEKKYSKPIQKRTEKKISSKDYEDSISSLSYENEFIADKAKLKSNQYEDESYGERPKVDEFSSVTLRKDVSKLTELSNSSQSSSGIQENKNIYITPGSSRARGMGNNNHKFEGSDYTANLGFFRKKDNRRSYLIKKQESVPNQKDSNKPKAGSFLREQMKYAEDTSKENSVSNGVGIIEITERTSNEENLSEREIRKDRLHVSLNLKLAEDPAEVSEVSSNSIASHSEKSLYNFQNEPLRILTYEDLIGAERSEPVDHETEDILLEEEQKLDYQTHKTVDDNSVSCMVKSDVKKSEIETSKLFSEEEYLEEISTNRECTDEYSIEEDINPLEMSISENSNIGVINTPQTSNHLERNENSDVTERREKESKDIFKVLQFQNYQVCDEIIQDVVHEAKNCGSQHIANTYYVGTDDRLLVTPNKKKFNEKGKCSDKDARLTLGKDKRQKHARHPQQVKEKQKSVEYVDNTIQQPSKSNCVLKANLCNVVTQTDEFLAETGKFEKRMGTIMKSSFDYFAETYNLQLEVNNIFPEQKIHSESSLIPLERGFHCALKQQVELIKHFVQAEHKMYEICMAAIKEMSATYKPSTLHSNQRMKSTDKQKLSRSTNRK